MKLNTGKKALILDFDGEDKETIYYNATDIGFFKRLIEMGENIKKDAEKMSNDIKLNENGKPAESIDYKEFFKFDDFIKSQFNEVFGYDVSSIIFKKCSPFAIIGGEFFINQFLNSLISEIAKEQTKAIKKMEKEQKKAMEKHLKKYDIK